MDDRAVGVADSSPAPEQDGVIVGVIASAWVMRTIRCSGAGMTTAASCSAEMARAASGSAGSMQRRGTSKGASVEAGGPMGGEQGWPNSSGGRGPLPMGYSLEVGPGGDVSSQCRGSASVGGRLDSAWWRWG
jgi:hypothetical protein